MISGHKGIIGECLELIHRAYSRDTFARGALRAAEWLTPVQSSMAIISKIHSVSAIYGAREVSNGRYTPG
jgi:hypothetical protein